MSNTFKNIEGRDRYFTTKTYHKRCEVSVSSFSDSGITVEKFSKDSEDFESRVKWKQINHLYKVSKTEFEEGFLGDKCIDENLNIPYSREQEDIYTVISIPIKQYGISIRKGSVKVILDSTELKDYRGVIVEQSENSYTVYGDIIYSHGLIILNGDYENRVNTLFWETTVDVHTWNYNCKVLDYELNGSNNRTAKRLQENSEIVGKFTPYITTVGLYNDMCELLAVAKLSKPIRKTSDIDMTFKVSVDTGFMYGDRIIDKNETEEG